MVVILIAAKNDAFLALPRQNILHRRLLVKNSSIR